MAEKGDFPKQLGRFQWRAELKCRGALVLAGVALALAARHWGLLWPVAAALGATWVALAPLWVKRRLVRYLEQRLGALMGAAWESRGHRDPYGFHERNRAEAAAAIPQAPLPPVPLASWLGWALAALLIGGALLRPALAPVSATMAPAAQPLAQGLQPPGVRVFPLPRAQSGKTDEYTGLLGVTDSTAPLPGAVPLAQDSVLERISQALALGAVTPGLLGEDLGQLPNQPVDPERFGSDLEQFLDQVVPPQPSEEGQPASPERPGGRRNPLGQRPGQSGEGGQGSGDQSSGQEGGAGEEGFPELEEGEQLGQGDSPGDLGDNGLTDQEGAGGVGSLGSDSLEVEGSSGTASGQEEFLRGQQRQGPSYAGAVRLPPQGEGLNRMPGQLPESYARAVEGASQDADLPAEYRQVVRKYFAGSP
ncbi:MAG: hypothetical protein HY335_00120 [Deinococcus sp.]|nr:hypothetical protein [Deinococcus sp.]